MNAPALSRMAVRKIARAVSYAMPRTLIAGTVKPDVSPRPRAMYRSSIDDALNANRLAELPDQPSRVFFGAVAEHRRANEAIHRRRGERGVALDRHAVLAHDDVHRRTVNSTLRSYPLLSSMKRLGSDLDFQFRLIRVRSFREADRAWDTRQGSQALTRCTWRPALVAGSIPDEPAPRPGARAWRR